MIPNNSTNDNKSWKPYTIAACSAVVLFVVLNNMGTILFLIASFVRILRPIIIGIVIAYLMNPLVRYISRIIGLSAYAPGRIVRNYIAVTVATAVIIALIFILLIRLIPQVVESVTFFISNINSYSESVQELFERLNRWAFDHNVDMDMVTGFSQKYVGTAVEFLTEKGRDIVNRSFSLGGDVANLFIGIILAIYFLVSKFSIAEGIDKLLTNTLEPRSYAILKTFARKCDEICTKFIVGEIIDAMIVAMINFVFMCIYPMPYAVLISVVVGVTNLAPTFGPFVGAAIGGFILLLAQSDCVLPFLICTLILQLVDGYIIKPKLFGTSLGVQGVWITVGIIAGGKLFGVIGILVAVPIVGIISYLLEIFTDKREQDRLLKEADKAYEHDMEEKAAEEAALQREAALESRTDGTVQNTRTVQTAHTAEHK